MKIPKKFTWEKLYQYVYGKQERLCGSILFVACGKFYVGFNNKGYMNLFDYHNIGEKSILKKQMTYEDMLYAIKQLKRHFKPFKNF